jgi:hypothetical protein
MSTAVDNDWLFAAKALPGHTAINELLRPGIGFSVDYGRLAIEWAIIAALYAACTAVFRPAKNLT